MPMLMMPLRHDMPRRRCRYYANIRRRHAFRRRHAIAADAFDCFSLLLRLLLSHTPPSI